MDFKKTILTLVLIILTKKNPRNKKTQVYSWITFIELKMRVENQTKTRVWEDSSLCPETSTKNAVQEFHLGVKVEIKPSSQQFVLLSMPLCQLSIGPILKSRHPSTQWNLRGGRNAAPYTLIGKTCWKKHTIFSQCKIYMQIILSYPQQIRIRIHTPFLMTNNFKSFKISNFNL